MTTEQLWHVAARVLGVYLLVVGALYLPGAIAVGGVVLPEGSSRIAFVAVPIVQAAISMLSGVLLLTMAGRTPNPAPATVDVQDQPAVALQLLGVFFAVQGMSGAVRPAIDMLYSGTSWYFRVGDFGAAAVGVAAGVVLTTRPGLISRRLQAFRQASG